MNGYCPYCGSDGDIWICDECGQQKCSDCLLEVEHLDGVCKVCPEVNPREKEIVFYNQITRKKTFPIPAKIRDALILKYQPDLMDSEIWERWCWLMGQRWKITIEKEEK